jgi:hypothetical protein
MVQKDFKPTGWLGLLMGTRLCKSASNLPLLVIWIVSERLRVVADFAFFEEAIAHEGEFMERMAAVERELGDRGRDPPRVPEGVPPALAAARSIEPSPAPAPAPAPAPVRAPAPVTPPQLQPAAAAAAAATPSPAAGYSPSIQMPSPAALALAPPPRAGAQQRSADETSLVHLLLEREDSLRHEAKAERAQQEAKSERKLQEMQQEMEKLRADLTPRAAVSAEQLRDLQSRLDTVHAAQLLTDAELYTLEDAVAVSLLNLIDAIALFVSCA